LATRHWGLLGTSWLQDASSIIATGVLGVVVLRHFRSRPYEPPTGPPRLPRWASAVVAGAVIVFGIATLAALWGSSLEVVAYNSVINTIDALLIAILALAVVWRLADR
jgi:hypothetical protein